MMLILRPIEGEETERGKRSDAESTPRGGKRTTAIFSVDTVPASTRKKVSFHFALVS